MYHPTTRLLTVLELLQTHAQMSSSELAARLEVDARTVRRYILMLQELGIPIEAEMGRHGGYTLRPGFKLPPLMFSNDEALALILGLLVARNLGLAGASWPIEGALAKLQRVLPAALHEQTEAMQSALVFNLEPPDQQIPTSLLIALGGAVHAARCVTIVYQSDGTSTRRMVDPYGVVFHDGVWYLVGYCHLRGAIRIFRLDRIALLELDSASFTPPDDFDSLGYLLQSFALMPDQWDVEVILKTTLESARRTIPASLGVLEAHPDGVRLRTSIASLDWMARYLVGLGFRLIVCQPAELRAAFERLAAEIVSYAATT
ncbi:MAG: WYL domain-containing protein [Chloroflexi bacterium]|nr:WYL domain-containing protein [Chloroflexota bacterium]